MHCSTSSVLAYPLPVKINQLGPRIPSAGQHQSARSSHALCLLPGRINQLGPRIPSPRYRSTSSSSHTLCWATSTSSVLAYLLPGKINQLGPHMPSAFCQARSTSSVLAYPPPGTDPPARLAHLLPSARQDQPARSPHTLPQVQIHQLVLASHPTLNEQHTGGSYPSTNAPSLSPHTATHHGATIFSSGPPMSSAKQHFKVSTSAKHCSIEAQARQKSRTGIMHKPSTESTVSKDGRVSLRRTDVPSVACPRCPAFGSSTSLSFFHSECRSQLSGFHANLTFDRAQRVLPPSLHLRIWKSYLRWAEHDGTEVGLNVWRRYLRANPSLTERYVRFILEAKRSTTKGGRADWGDHVDVNH
ncbi:hypothetical protein A4X13_0g1745 [Tilletia indica]|uniref:Pre-mRNA-splicing factor Syf1-like N-terminal HAT-repeats domain-containing protein n=1 Tax=Tilletia indica TaxID=43049 RepID=A0A8T8TCP1_9BASI|nr:hypothetical protein A4X13_0g1745 [Tilletia indica]